MPTLYATFAADVVERGFTHAVLLGMGGSSLGPEVLAETFGAAAGFPELLVLDSTDPAQMRAIGAEHRSREAPCSSSRASPARPSSPTSCTDYFFARPRRRCRRAKAGAALRRRHRSGLVAGEACQGATNSARIFHGEPSIGGRYSVLSEFRHGARRGDAASTCGAFLRGDAVMARACGADVPPAANPGAAARHRARRAAAREGRDKVTFVASPGLADFGAWLEQLIAESTGKHGKGLIPVDAEPLGRARRSMAHDRLFVHLRLDGDDNAGRTDAALGKLAESRPSGGAASTLADGRPLGQEFFRWEIATAVAGAVIGINPFDQPDVEASKIKTRELTAAYEKSGALPAEAPLFAGRRHRPLCRRRQRQGAARRGRRRKPRGLAARAFRAALKPGDYAALLAYIDARRRSTPTCSSALRIAVRDRLQGRDLRWVSARASCIPPARPTRAGPTAASSCRSRRLMRSDLPVPGQRFSSASSRPRRPAAISRCWPSAAGARCACMLRRRAAFRGTRRARRDDRTGGVVTLTQSSSRAAQVGCQRYARN